jgi:hypothetical protein
MFNKKTRAYTQNQQKISSKAFRKLLTAPLGYYYLNGGELSDEHRKFELRCISEDLRAIVFTINKVSQVITLSVDNRSASSKLFFCYPFCKKQRMYLYVTKGAYACRVCLDLHYASQSESSQARLARRIVNLRANIWGKQQDGVKNMFSNINRWGKPTHIKLSSFKKLKARINQLEAEYWEAAKKEIDNTYGKAKLRTKGLPLNTF